MNASQLDAWFKSSAAAQLDTFNKTISFTATVYKKAEWDGLNSGHRDPGAYGSATTTSVGSRNYYIGAGQDSVFSGDLASGIGAGQVAKSQDVATSVSNAVKSAVDKIEATLGNTSFSATVCHNSCHSNCHGSRGRR